MIIGGGGGGRGKHQAILLDNIDSSLIYSLASIEPAGGTGSAVNTMPSNNNNNNNNEYYNNFLLALSE